MRGCDLCSFATPKRRKHNDNHIPATNFVFRRVPRLVDGVQPALAARAVAHSWRPDNRQGHGLPALANDGAIALDEAERTGLLACAAYELGKRAKDLSGIPEVALFPGSVSERELADRRRLQRHCTVGDYCCKSKGRISFRPACWLQGHDRRLYSSRRKRPAHGHGAHDC